MKIIEGRVVCSGCKEPFQVGQKYFFIQKEALSVDGLQETNNLPGIPWSRIMPSYIETIDIFHEDCN